MDINQLMALKLQQIEQGNAPRPETLKMLTANEQPMNNALPTSMITPDAMKQSYQAQKPVVEKEHALDVGTTKKAEAQQQNNWVQDILKAIPGIAKGAVEFGNKPAGMKTFAALNSDPYMKEALLNRGNEMQKIQETSDIKNKDTKIALATELLKSGTPEGLSAGRNLMQQAGISLPENIQIPTGTPSISNDYFVKDDTGKLSPILVQGGKMLDPVTRNPIDQSKIIAKEQLTLDQARYLKEQALSQAKQFHEDMLSNKNTNDTTKHNAHQDALEKTYSDRMMKVISNRSGGLGLQDAKVNQAIHLGEIFNQYYDPQKGTYNIPRSQYEEVAIGLANLISPTGQATDSMRQGIIQKTSVGDINGAIGYITGTTPSGSTSDVFKNLAESIDRQGLISERQRDHYIDGIKKLAPKDLEEDRKEAISNSNLANSFSQWKEISPSFSLIKAKNPPLNQKQVPKAESKTETKSDIVDGVDISSWSKEDKEAYRQAHAVVKGKKK